MTKQEIFDKVWAGLASQGFKRSVDRYGDCMYRGEEGRKCAAGHVIPDDEYDPSFENNCVKYLDTVCPTLGSLDRGCMDLLFDTQMAHDNSPTPECMQRRLRDLAAKHGVNVPGDA